MSSPTRLLAGLATTWFLFIIGVLQDGADDAIFRIFIGVIPSTIFAAFAWAGGLMLRVTPIKNLWVRLGPFVLLFVIVGSGILILSTPLGLTHDEVDFDTGGTFKVMNPWLLITAYSLAIFPIVNWPKKKPSPTPPS